jgi:hypothetical protein
LTSFSPAPNPQFIESDHLTHLRPLPSNVLVEQVSEVFHYLVPELHPHALFGQRTEQRFQHQLAAVSPFVACKVRRQSLQLVARNESAIGTHYDAVQIIADGKLLTQRRMIEFSLMPFDCHRHSIPPSDKQT